MRVARSGLWLTICIAGAGSNVVFVPGSPAQPKPVLRQRVVFAFQLPDGTPAGQGLKAHLYDRYAEVGTPVVSDEAGTIVFEGLPPGLYDLWVEGAMSQSGTQADIPGTLFRMLEVTAGDGTQTISLQLPRASAISGRLLLADDLPADGYVVAVQTGTLPDEAAPYEAWPAAYARGALSCYAETRTGADGTFLLRGLTPGRHALDVRRPGERQAFASITGIEVTPGGTAQVGTVELPSDAWQYLWDGKSLSEWAESDFYGRSEVRIERDRIVLTTGSDMTGITYQGELPRVDYEVCLQAMRVEGNDFFCGLTFPVKDDNCSLILGGWGGSLVGLSSLDGADASENETTQWIQFQQHRWYRVRVRVTADRITAWLDEKQIVDVSIANRRVGIRIECEPSRPLGIATWRTTGAIRDIRLRKL